MTIVEINIELSKIFKKVIIFVNDMTYYRLKIYSQHISITKYRRRKESIENLPLFLHMWEFYHESTENELKQVYIHFFNDYSNEKFPTLLQDKYQLL